MDSYVISLGGSIIVPEKINVSFLKKFRKLVISHSPKKKFIVIAGGGKTARKYQKAARQVTKLMPDDLDWIGIHSTRLNAHLLRTVLRDIAHPKIVKDPNQRINFKKLLVGAGWKPGCSTDYDAVLLAKTYGIKTVINMTSLDYLHNKDPAKYQNTQIIKQTDWKNFRKIVGYKWSPGLNSPFDPEAAKLAQKLKLKLVLIGPNLKNLDNLLKNKEFKGSVVEN